MKKYSQKELRLYELISSQKERLKDVLKKDNQNILKTSLNYNQFHYAIMLINLGSTILFYNEEYIYPSSRDEGLGNKLNIWNYLCKMDNTDNILNSHRRKLGFPIDKEGFPIISSRQLQGILSGEKINQNSKLFVERFYKNKNFKTMLSEWQNSPVLNGKITKKNMNKMEDIIEHMEYNNIFPILDRKLQVKLKRIKEFTNWRVKNPDIWNKLVDELHCRTTF
jgi:hypothetical protein